jgi:hypothetical protein
MILQYNPTFHKKQSDTRNQQINLLIAVQCRGHNQRGHHHRLESSRDMPLHLCEKEAATGNNA